MEDNTRVFDQALAMSPIERAVLIEKLFQSFDQKNQKAVDQAWATEAESRIDAYEAGKISARPFEGVLHDLNNR
ncbi:MAG: addiction module protein [Proteobacteria bacterium]|nr:addiction module protein [Pseudomonadota bacterium]MBU1060736.1 addiction module protein [Pseudomonadota bacterium]